MEKTCKNKINKEMIKKRILPTILVAFLIPLILCLSIPFEMFSKNINELLFSVHDIMPMLILIALSITAVIFLILLFLPEKIYKILCYIIIAFSLMLFIQGTYLNGSVNSLAGDNLSASAPTMFSKILNLSIWIIVVAGFVVLAILKDKKGIIATIKTVIIVAIIATQVITPISCMLTNDQLFLNIDERLALDNTEINHKILTRENLTDISTTNNVYYFCIDRFDERYAESAYTKYPDVYDNLTGFTWFQDNISMFDHTYPAASNMLTNIDFDSTIFRKEYLNSAYAENKTLSVLASNGYDINLHTPSYYAFTDAAYLPDYVTNSKEATKFNIKSHFQLAWDMMKLSFFRVSPLLLKSIYMGVNSDSCNSNVKEYDANDNEKYTTDMKEIYDFVSKSSFSSTSNKVFNFIHLDGCHSVTYDENWNNISMSSNNDISISVKTSFMIINKYIEAMKLAGVYDDATIIITGDHGAVSSNLTALSKPILTALFVKPSGSNNEPVKISQAQTSHSNIWATIIKSENITTEINYGKSVFEIPENENQVRKHINHTYYDTLDEYFYEITGPGKDFNNWKVIDHKHYNKSIMD